VFGPLEACNGFQQFRELRERRKYVGGQLLAPANATGDSRLQNAVTSVGIDVDTDFSRILEQPLGILEGLIEIAGGIGGRRSGLLV
jgi:hypothetical protein